MYKHRISEDASLNPQKPRSNVAFPLGLRILLAVCRQVCDPNKEVIESPCFVLNKSSCRSVCSRAPANVWIRVKRFFGLNKLQIDRRWIFLLSTIAIAGKCNFLKVYFLAAFLTGLAKYLKPLISFCGSISS